MNESSLSKCVGMMRQWLNEDRITDDKKLVTSEELLHWLKPFLTEHEALQRNADALFEAMERLSLEFKANACACGEEWKDTDGNDICDAALSAYREATKPSDV